MIIRTWNTNKGQQTAQVIWNGNRDLRPRLVKAGSYKCWNWAGFCLLYGPSCR